MLPTTYIFHPEYFEENEVYINSVLEDLEKGMLKISESKKGSLINMPEGIKDKDAFYIDMFQNLNKQGRFERYKLN